MSVSVFLIEIEILFNSILPKKNQSSIIKQFNTIVSSNMSEVYNNTKAIYLKYIETMDKSDSPNSQARLQFELSMLKSMYKLANQNNDNEELEFINKRFEIVSGSFKKYFGIVVKELSDNDS